MAGDDAVAVLGTGQCFFNVLGGGVGLSHPCELVADGGVEAGVTGVVDRQLQGDDAVAAVNALESFSIITALGVGLSHPCELVADGL